MNFKEQNDELMTAFYERTFYKGFRDPDDEKYQNFRSLELIMTYKCNLSCKYCYVNRFGEELYPPELYEDDEVVFRNLRLVVAWLKENEFRPKIEIFTGEAFIQPITFRCLDYIIEELGNHERRLLVVIPTNFSFLLSDSLTSKVEAILQKAQDNGVDISLSGSFDGKYCESNRPFKMNVKGHSVSPARVWTWEHGDVPDPRDDAYYDKAFAFNKKWGFGFHPMIYSDNIKHWKENFLWFQEKFIKHDNPWMFLYLLEVRNVEWSNQQIKDYAEFIKFLWRWAWDKCDRDFKKFWYFLFNRKGFNILSSPLTTVGRGIGCSIQGTMMIRLGDLIIPPCHRTSYEPFIFGKMKVKEDVRVVEGYIRADGTKAAGYIQDRSKIVGVEANNFEMMIGIYSTDSKNFPYCESCLIAPLCNRGCFGSQYEVTGDVFTPIPTVCRMYHAKMKALIEVMMELGMFEQMLGRINKDKAAAFQALRSMMEE